MQVKPIDPLGSNKGEELSTKATHRYTITHMRLFVVWGYPKKLTPKTPKVEPELSSFPLVTVLRTTSTSIFVTQVHLVLSEEEETCYTPVRATWCSLESTHSPGDAHAFTLGKHTCSSRTEHPSLPASPMTSSTQSVSFAVLATKTRELPGFTVT